MRPALLLISFFMVLSSASHAQVFSSPESIVWDSLSERYLVSNSGDGLLRAVDEYGVVSLYGIEAKASHGLIIVGDRLYACFRNSVRSYDLESESLVDVYMISGAKFLNGITSDKDNNLYVTDFTTKSIFRVELDNNGSMKSARVWKQLDRIPNGIGYLEAEDEFIVLTWGSNAEVLTLDRSTARITERRSSGLGNLEGIFISEKGEVYISAWSPGAIYKYSDDHQGDGFKQVVVGLEKPTGLCLDSDGQLLHLTTESRGIEGLAAKTKVGLGVLELSVFPNPISYNSLISYKVAETGVVTVSIYDCRGALVERVLTENKSAGQHQFIYDRAGHPNGLYFIHIQSTNDSQAMAVTFMD